VHVHDPQAGGSPYVGPGWDARISGPVDIAFSADGGTAYLLCEQSDDVIVVPTSTPAVKPAGAASLREIAVGSRPLGIALSPTSDLAFVANSLSRDVSVIDLAAGSEVRRIPVTPLTGEPLPEYARRGARLFHSSTDPRLSASGKIACASCHPHGEHDGRHWDFHHLPGSHGPRSSMSLLGIGATLGARDAATGFGQLHRSGDRDELQDFEHTARSPLMGGTGFLGPSPPAELGPPSAGLDPDLDALAGYIASLPPLRRSPHRAAGGALTEAAIRGATFFLGTNRASKPADAGCAACHVPESGFVDFRFHDVGQRRAGGEEELGSRTPAWHVNTPTLAGVWSTPPHDGVAGFSSTILAVLEDSVARARTSTPHGKPDGLTRRQLADLAELVLSIDGDMTVEEIRSARDTTPPRIIRVEPASLEQVDVWFSEAVDPATAGRAESWSIQGTGGGLAPIASASVDPLHGDRVTLETSLEAGEPPIEYRVTPTGTILDRADSATGGIANALDPADASNVKTFTLGSTLTVTLGASGEENIPVRVHDAAMVGPGLDTWSHDSVWVFPLAGGGRNTGFVRFDWVDAFRSATGVNDPAAILDAGFSLQPEWGLAQPLELRRVLRPWSDPATGSDWNSNPTGGPSWRDHSHPSGRWAQTGAGALGGTGAAAADYGAAFDLAATVDATITPPSINERSWFRGPKITEAFRFWLENPGLDHGYALRVTPGATQEIKFERAEADLGRHGPVLEITYALPVTRSRISFHRGNADGSAGTDITDAIHVLNHLFLGLPAPACLDAADIQNDGLIDISDPIALLGFIFLGGEPPAPPGPFTGPCGPDPDPPGSPGDLGCHVASDC
jgi:hypothetical protein